MWSFFIASVEIQKYSGKMDKSADLSSALPMRKLRLERIFEKRKIREQKGIGSKSLDIFDCNNHFFSFCLFSSRSLLNDLAMAFPFLTYQEVLDSLFQRHQRGIKLGLETMEVLLERIGHPEKKFASIHIAGTNGKGSTAAMLESILRCAGYRTGLYTSPHLMDMRERIQVNGELISKEDVISGMNQLHPEIQTTGASYFESLTALAFYYFAQKKVDVAILETGLGGRLDATNVVLPELTLITEIGHEHTQILGKRLDQIAKEKAGIMKTGVPCIVGTRKFQVRKVFSETAHSKKIPLDFAQDQVKILRFHVNERHSHFDAFTPQKMYSDLMLPLLGFHQLENVKLVLSAVDRLCQQGWNIPQEAVRQGLACVQWRGRLEVLQRDPTILVDCAHNPMGARVLAHALRTLFQYRHLILVFGVLEDKDYRKMLRYLSPLANQIVLTRPASERARDPEQIRSALFPFATHVAVFQEIPKAWEFALGLAKKDDLVCGTGSIYLVGELLKLNISQK